jgi:CRP/FNR family transcriptional regulator
MELANSHFLRCLETLKESSFFRDIDKDTMQDMLTSMTRTHWAAGTFRNGREVESTLHFIVSGRIKEYQLNPHTGREHTIFLLSKGDVFDILSLMDSQAHDVYWEAVDDMEILNISMVDMRRWIMEHPSMNRTILKYLGHRMRQLEEAATDISLHSTLIRLSHLLLNNINGHSHQLQLINNLPNNEIASLIGTTRAVVNRHIQELKKCGAISVKRSQIDIENVELLLAIAEEKYIP